MASKFLFPDMDCIALHCIATIYAKAFFGANIIQRKTLDDLILVEMQPMETTGPSNRLELKGQAFYTNDHLDCLAEDRWM
jgi:hypothetical protein